MCGFSEPEQFPIHYGQTVFAIYPRIASKIITNSDFLSKSQKALAHMAANDYRDMKTNPNNASILFTELLRSTPVRIGNYLISVSKNLRYEFWERLMIIDGRLIENFEEQVKYFSEVIATKIDILPKSPSFVSILSVCQL